MRAPFRAGRARIPRASPSGFIRGISALGQSRIFLLRRNSASEMFLDDIVAGLRAVRSLVSERMNSDDRTRLNWTHIWRAFLLPRPALAGRVGVRALARAPRISALSAVPPHRRAPDDASHRRVRGDLSPASGERQERSHRALSAARGRFFPTRSRPSFSGARRNGRRPPCGDRSAGSA